MAAADNACSYVGIHGNLIMLETFSLNGLACNVHSRDGQIKRNRRGIVLLGSGNGDPPAVGNIQDPFLNALCAELANRDFVAVVVGYRAGQAVFPNGGFNSIAWDHNTQQMSDDFSNVLDGVVALYGGSRSVGVVGGVSYAGFILGGALTQWGALPKLGDIRGLLLACAGTAPVNASRLAVPVLNKICNQDSDSDDGQFNVGGAHLYDALNPLVQADSHCETDMSMQGHTVNPNWVAWFVTRLEAWLPAISAPATWNTLHGAHPSGATPVPNADEVGQPMYIARAIVNGTTHPTPGKVRPDWTAAAIPFGGQEVWISDYELYQGPVVLIPRPANNADLANIALQGGVDIEGSPLYVAIVTDTINNHPVVVPGKLRPDWTAAAYCWGGVERWSSNYQLVAKP